MLTIQFASDTHVEFYGARSKYGFIEPRGDILVLAGDICCAASLDDFNVYKKFVLEHLGKFKHIIMVAGNHEYYYTANRPTLENTIQAVNKRLTEFAAAYPTLHFLNNRAVQLKHNNTPYIFIGSTMWTNIPAEHHTSINKLMNDYANIYVEDAKKVRKLTPMDVCNMHNRSVAYIKRVLAKTPANSKVIMISHHKPYNDPIEGPREIVSYGYSTDQTKLMAKISLWIFGHVHKASAVRIGSCRVVGNPRGYPHQRTMYQAGRIVMV
jgi:predicted phosphohydrolase